MKKSAQSMIEFAVILLFVTGIAMVSLQIISNRINSNVYNNIENSQTSENESVQENEALNCTKMGLSWDKQNGVCEAK